MSDRDRTTPAPKSTTEDRPRLEVRSKVRAGSLPAMGNSGNLLESGPIQFHGSDFNAG